jgi:hypothetical protein
VPSTHRPPACFDWLSVLWCVSHIDMIIDAACVCVIVRRRRDREGVKNSACASSQCQCDEWSSLDGQQGATSKHASWSQRDSGNSSSGKHNLLCAVLCCAVLSSRVCTDIPLNGIRLRLPLASCRCLWVATARNWKPKPGGVRHSLRPACCSSSANLSVVQSVNPRPTTWTPIGNGVSSLDVPIATGQTMCPSQRGRRWTAGGRGRYCPTRSSLSCRSNRR